MDVTTCNHSQSVNEGMYTVSGTANNIVGSSEKTSIYFSKLTHFIVILNLWSLLDARWLQNVSYEKSDDNNRIDYTTATCTERDDLNISLAYNNKDTNNIMVIETKPYMANITDSFILPSSLQPSAVTHKLIIQVVTIDGIIVSTINITSTFTSPISVILASSLSKKYYCNNWLCTH